MKKASEESAVVFFDVDGTLIEGEHPPSVQVARSIRNLADCGHVPVLCTGPTNLPSGPRIERSSLDWSCYPGGCICSMGGGAALSLYDADRPFAGDDGLPVAREDRIYPAGG